MHVSCITSCVYSVEFTHFSSVGTFVAPRGGLQFLTIKHTKSQIFQWGDISLLRGYVSPPRAIPLIYHSACIIYRESLLRRIHTHYRLWTAIAELYCLECFFYFYLDISFHCMNKHEISRIFWFCWKVFMFYALMMFFSCLFFTFIYIVYSYFTLKEERKNVSVESIRK